MKYNQIGLQIKKLRKNKNLTQEQLSNILDVSMQAVSKWECGGTPDIETLIKLSHFFGVSTDSLLGINSNNEQALEEILFNDINSTHTEYKLEKVCRYCWSMLKALSAMPSIKDDDYCKVAADEMICTQSRVTSNQGIVSMSAIEAFHYFIVMPEPEEGYKIALSNIDKYSVFFKCLSEPNNLKILSYLYSVKSTLFSAEKAAKDLNIPRAEVDKILHEFCQNSWVFKESATLNDFDVDLYRPNNSTAFIPLLRFATEMIEMPDLWYIGYFERNTPYLKNMLDS